MTDDQYKDMVIDHDKHIDTLAGSIENLAINVSDTNSKLGDVIEVMSHQTVLVERMNNMDNNVSESFKRAWGRLEKLEVMVDTNGCNIAKGLAVESNAFKDKLVVVNKRIKGTEESVTKLSDKLNETVTGNVIRWALGLLIVYSVTFGTYVVQSIHNTDTVIASYIAKDTEVREYTSRRLDDIVDIMRYERGSVITHGAPAGPKDRNGNF